MKAQARFLNKNGYDMEREEAATIFDETTWYDITYARMGRSTSSFKFSGIDGSWNTVMFETRGKIDWDHDYIIY